MEKEYTGERFVPEECNDEMRIEHMQRYHFASDFVKGKYVVDAACGEGYGSKILSKTAAQVIGLDIDEKVVGGANEKYGNDKLKYITASVEKIPLEDHSVDVFVSFETIEHVTEEIQQKFLAEVKRVLKKDGVLIISSPNKRIYTDAVEGVNKFHIKEFYYTEYQNFLGEFFEHIDMYKQYPYTGYFINNFKESFTCSVPVTEEEDSRYFVAVCSDEPIDRSAEAISNFNDQMYYFLNRQSHRMEKQIVSMKEETDAFERKLTDALAESKEYIQHLEKDIQSLKDQVNNLLKEKDEQDQKFSENIRRQQEKYDKLHKEYKKTIRYKIQRSKGE